MSADVLNATVHQLNVSQGGVPKRPVAESEVEESGLVLDRQKHTRFHGGPTRAVSLLGLDVIERLQAAGHPIAPGTTGENVTVAGVDWREVPLGTRFVFEGGVVLEALSFAKPCKTIRRSFTDGAIRLLDAERSPGNARIYARVLQAGRLQAGERLRLDRPAN